MAFTHSSAPLKNTNRATINNERLEYLGDAILGAIIAEILYKKFANKDEGFLTEIRSKIVSRESLNKLAIKIGLDKYVVSKSFLLNKHIYGDAFEALIGAIFLDQGYQNTKQFIKNKIFHNHINLEKLVILETNYKSKLIEWAQKNKKYLFFDTHEEQLDNAHNLPVFISAVEVENVVMGKGTGHSKKESQQKAACEALNKLGQN